MSGSYVSRSGQPRHVSIVMDGNGRWAKKRNLPRIAGHRRGGTVVRKVIEYAAEQSLEVLSLFTLSVENFLFRPRDEIKFLISFLYESLAEHTAELHQNNIRIRFIGDRNGLDERLCELFSETEALTAQNTGMTLVLAVNYSGRWDILQATRQLIAQGQSEEHLSEHLSLADLPEPDLLIRTSGEQRISNFMLWQLAYTELYFTPTLWPDFTAQEFASALAFYQTRQRRFGKTDEQITGKNTAHA